MPELTLLCVDDERAGLQVRRLILERQGYSVLTAESGPAGLELFSEQDVHGVVLDYYMPQMLGGEVARAMKKLKPQVPIIMLSAYISLPPEALAAVDAYIVKGDSPQALIDKLKELLKNHTR